MTIALYTAALLLIAVGIAHSWLGERYILTRLFRRDNLPKLFGGTEFTVRTLRFAWHLTTVAWFGFAAVAVLLADPPASVGAIGAVIAAVFVVHGLITLIASRGRHLAWPVFILVGVLVAFASANAGDAALPDGASADLVVVEKAIRKLSIYSGGQLLKTYDIALGFEPVGHKRQEGDGRTPEGRYVIDYRNPQSSYHRSLHISYPDEEDRRRAAERGVSPGGDIFIHGLAPRFAWVGAGHTATDWTEGCIAVTSEEIEELWRAVPDGTPIEIRP